MKHLAAILLIVFPSLTWANSCPNLEGTYKCSNRRSLVVAQGQNSEGTTSYSIRGLLNGELRAIADGATRNEGGASVTARCTNDGALQIQLDHERGTLDFAIRKQGSEVVVQGPQEIRCKQ